MDLLLVEKIFGIALSSFSQVVFRPMEGFRVVIIFC